jgi:hypothetical protein
MNLRVSGELSAIWKHFSEQPSERPAESREVGRSQGVDATLAQSLLVAVYEADFVRRRQIKQNKSPD